MLNKGTRFMATILAMLLLSCLLVLPVAAAGMGVGPSHLEITDALRGGEYERLLTLFNLGNEEVTFGFSVTGEAGAWISFYKKDAPDIRIEKINVEKEKEAGVLVKFSIPQEAGNGDYVTIISVTTIPDDEEGEAVQAVALSAQVKVDITVTGTQILSGVISSIRIRDIEEGYPLRIEAFFQNNGNVEATPQFDVEMVKNNQTVATFTVADTRVSPDSSEMFHVECDTTDNSCGDYLCNVTVSLDNEVIAAEECRFTILPRGTLTRSGVCTEMALDSDPKIGIISKLKAVFLNDGQIDTNAKLVAEIFRDGVLVDVINGDELLVPVGYSTELVAYLRPESPGKYNVKTHVLYEGKRTDPKTLSFEVSSTNNPVSGEGGGPEWQWVLFSVLVAVMLAGLTSPYWIKKLRPESMNMKE